LVSKNDTLENAVIYFLKISSENSNVDNLYDLLELETIYNLFIGDVINLKNKSHGRKLLEDYKTHSF